MSKRAEFFVKGQERLAKPYHYLASGLDNIFLLNGVSTEETPYGPMVTIHRLNGLHRAIGLHIIEKPEPMCGPEFRFLRKQMKLTQKELASAMQISDQTIANYEKGKTELGPADPLMRISYLVHIVPDETRAELLKMITDKLGVSQRARLPDVPRLKLVQQWREELKKAA